MGKRALLGLAAGMIATGIYDLLRLGLVWAGLWGDPIPGIGRMALADPNADPVWGYVWRFIGNGGGMSLAFAMLPWRGVRLGIPYGSAICLGLLGLLAFWPESQLHFFTLNPVTAGGAMAGNANVKALMYVDALVPDQGQTLLERAIAEPGSCVAGDPVLLQHGFRYDPTARRPS